MALAGLFTGAAEDGRMRARLFCRVQISQTAGADGKNSAKERAHGARRPKEALHYTNTDDLWRRAEDHGGRRIFPSELGRWNGFSKKDWLSCRKDVDSRSIPEMGNHFYSVFGLRVHANRPVHIFPPSEPGEPDVWLHLEGSNPRPFGNLDRIEWCQGTDNDEFGEPCLRGWQLDGGNFLHFQYSDGVDFFFDRAGESMWAFWPEHLDLDYVLTYLAGPIFGYLLLVRGITCLHASAVAVGDKAVAVLGPQGAGKSTTAAAFALSRFPVLSDDIVAVTEHDGQFMVQPAFLRLCLWPKSVEALYGSAEALPRLTESWEKQGLELGEGACRFQQRPLPLAAIYVLGERTSQNPHGTISPLAPRESLLRLLGNTYAGHLPNDRREQEFDELARLVNRVPARRVTPHPSPSHIRGLCGAIIEDFARLDR